MKIQSLKIQTLSAAIALGLAGLHPAASADSLEARVQRLESKNAELEATVRRQQASLAEQKAATEGEPERLKPLSEGLSASTLRSMISGLIEVEAGHVSPYTGDAESDIILATFELGIEAQINDWVKATASLLYEQDETDLEVDVASITIANADATPFFITAGQIYVPFGAFETNLVSDPLTLEIGETRESAVQAGFVSGDFLGSLYVFNGDNKIDGKNRVGSWGANLGYAHEQDGSAWGLGVGYISDLGDSDSLQEVIDENLAGVDPADRTAGWTLNATAKLGPVTLIGEYLTAADEFDTGSLDFDGTGAKPSAWNLEAGFSFPVLGRESVAALAYQGTREAVGLALPEERLMLGWSVEVFERTSLSLEWAHDKDYAVSDGGTGESADTFTAQLAVEF